MTADGAGAQPDAHGGAAPHDAAATPSTSTPSLRTSASSDEVALVQAFYERVLEALPAQLAVFSPAGEYEYVTPSAIADPDVRRWIVGKTDVQYAELRGLPAEVPVRRLGTIRKVVQEGKPYTFEESFTTKQGDLRYFRRFVTPVTDANGNVQHVLGYGIDITDQRRAEEQLRQAQKMEAIGRLAGGVAHDFNNLITIIGGFADCLDGSFDTDDPRRTTLQSIREAADRAAELTRQLLSFSRRAPLELSTIDVHDIVRDTAQMLGRVIGERVQVELDLHASQPWVRADRGQFKQILLNLVLNARDAMPHGGLLVLSTRRVQAPVHPNEQPTDAADGPYLELTVTDTGVGMSAHTLAHLFEPFFTTKAPDKGTGLGLSTVYGIVTQLGGRVLAESTLGQGATFRVLLPVAPAPQGGQLAAAPETTRTSRGGTILVAEDENGVRLLVRRLLSEAGYVVLEASCGADAMQILETHHGSIDLLLTDVVMADFGGRTLADAARVLRPTLRVLYMSGYADDDHLLESSAPAEAFLDKPFTREELYRAVDELMQLTVGRIGA